MIIESTQEIILIDFGKAKISTDETWRKQDLMDVKDLLTITTLNK
jgi:hypothetical protein